MNDYALAQGMGWPANRKSPLIDPPTVTSAMSRKDVSSPPFQPRTPMIGGRTHMNVKSDRRCFQCDRYGHLMYNCMSIHTQTVAGTSRALHVHPHSEVQYPLDARSKAFHTRARSHEKRNECVVVVKHVGATSKTCLLAM